MSATICREKYFNYGSYLRSRGYDKEICNLVSNIENGNIRLGSFTPNGTTDGGTITGNLNITGTLETQGGSNATGSGVGAGTFVPSGTFPHGIQVAGVSNLAGMILQDDGNSDPSGNIFSIPSGSKHLFKSGAGATNTIVDISGDLVVGNNIDISGEFTLDGSANLAGSIIQSTTNTNGNVFAVPSTTNHLFKATNEANKTQVDISGDLYATGDISFGSTTSSLAFFGASGTTQTTTADIAATYTSVGGVALQLNDTFTHSGGSAYTVGHIVESLYQYGLLQ